MSTTPSVAVLGLGAMGTALAEALLGAGFETTVWNRTAARAEPLVAQGATVADSPAAAITAADVAIVCLLDYASVEEVLAPAADALRDTVLVNLTNGTPDQARELASWAGERGFAYLDGGIMAVPPTIGQPGSFVFYSGSSAAYELARPALETFGEVHYLGADAGLAPLYDIALLTGMYGQTMGELQAYALVTGAGVPAADLTPYLSRWLEAMRGFEQRTAEQIDTGDYTTGVVSNLAMQSAAFVNLLLAADQQGVSPELLVPFRALLERRTAAGHGGEDLAGLIELIRPLRTS